MKKLLLITTLALLATGCRPTGHAHLRKGDTDATVLAYYRAQYQAVTVRMQARHDRLVHDYQQDRDRIKAHWAGIKVSHSRDRASERLERNYAYDMDKLARDQAWDLAQVQADLEATQEALSR